MNENPSPFSTFYLTGERPGDDPADVGPLRPALFSAYQDLSKLRYDFPLVLVNGDADGAFARSLSDIIDGILQEIAPRGIEGERLRRHMLALEEGIRTLASRGRKGSLLQLWDLAETALLSKADDSARKSLSDSLSRARALASLGDEIPVGVLYRDPSVPCYDDLRAGERPNTPDLIRTVLDEEFDKVTIWPQIGATPLGAE